MRKRKNVKKLFERQETCVCKRCGGKLEVHLIEYNHYGGHGLDLYCPNCRVLEYGVAPEVYSLAKSFMEQFEFNYFADLEENERTYELNMSKLCDIMAWAVSQENKEQN